MLGTGQMIARAKVGARNDNVTIQQPDLSIHWRFILHLYLYLYLYLPLPFTQLQILPW